MSTFDESKYDDSTVVPKNFQEKMQCERRLKEATEIAGEVVLQARMRAQNWRFVQSVCAALAKRNNRVLQT